MTKLLSLGWGIWAYGLFRGAISGGATSIISSFAAMGIDPEHFNLSKGLGDSLKLLGAMFTINAIYRMAEYLKDHPLPEIEPPEK